MKLPGVCIVCRRPVYLTTMYRTVTVWRNPGGKRHVCPPERSTCGAWMPYAKDRCARRPGHRDEHRTRYALDNAYRRNVGRERAA